MGVIRSGTGVLLVVLLTANLFAANAIGVADRTVSNDEFVTSTLEEEDAYAVMQSIVVDRFEERLGNADVPLPDAIDVNRTIRRALTRSYLETQTQANVERLYDYLHGRRGDLRLVIDTTRVKENLAAAVEDRVRNMTVEALLGFVTTRGNLTVPLGGAAIDLSVVGDMAKSRREYREARRALRQRIRTRIEAQVPPGTSEERIDGLVNRTLRRIRQQAKAAVRTVVADAMPERFQPVVDPATQVALVGVNGLTTDMTYRRFEERLAAAKAALAENVSAVVRTELDEVVGDRMALTEQFSQSLRNRIQRARTLVGIVDLLAIGLPVLALVLVGLLSLLTRSLPATAVGTGSALTITGAVSYVVASWVPGFVESRLALSNVPSGAADVVFGVIEQVADVAAAQSLALLALGVLCLAVGVAVRFYGAEIRTWLATLADRS